MRILTGGKAREPINWLTWLDSKADSTVWMEEDVKTYLISLFYPEDLSSGFIYDLNDPENKIMEGFLNVYIEQRNMDYKKHG